MVDDGILQTGISKYRHWFSFLKMALEMQQQEAVLIYKKKEHKIKVDESMYVGWDFLQIKGLSVLDSERGETPLLRYACGVEAASCCSSDNL